MATQKKVRNPKIVRLVSQELGVNEDLVAEIAAAQSAFTVQTVRTGLFEGVTWPYLGKIKANPRKVHYKNQKKGEQTNIQKP